MTYEVALHALGKDAAMWEQTSSVLTDEGGNARMLNLTTADLSFAADWTGLTTTYAGVQSKVADLLTGGGTETEHIATVLRTVKKNYEDNEAKAKASYHGTWEYK